VAGKMLFIKLAKGSTTSVLRMPMILVFSQTNKAYFCKKIKKRYDRRWLFEGKILYKFCNIIVSLNDNW
jgi:hypothetical protein